MDTQSGFRRIPSRKRLALVLIMSLSLAVFAGSLGLTYIHTVVPYQTKRHRPALPGQTPAPTQPGELAFQGQERMNILVLGIDNNYDSKGMPFTKGARSDSMMLVSLSKDARFLNIVSIPRDTYVTISERYGREKINAAYAVGGPEQAMLTVGRFLNVPVDHYVVVKIAGAKKVIDALGGLPVEVEKDMDYDDNWGHLHVHLKKGPQVLTGEQAIGYARFRKDEEGDRGRMRRQQQVLRIMVGMLKSPTLAYKFPALAKAVKATLQTDLGVAQMVDLAMLYKGFDRQQVRGGQIEGDDDMINGVSVIIPNQQQNEKVVRALLKNETDLALKEMRVCVLNGSKESGAAQRLADQLAVEGLQVVKVDLADRDNYPATQIMEHIKIERIHGRLAGLLPGATFTNTTSPSKDYDVTIIVGNDKVAVHSAPSARDSLAQHPTVDRPTVDRSVPVPARVTEPSPEALPSAVAPPPLDSYVPRSPDGHATPEALPSATPPEPRDPRPSAPESRPPAPEQRPNVVESRPNAEPRQPATPPDTVPAPRATPVMAPPPAPRATPLTGPADGEP